VAATPVRVREAEAVLEGRPRTGTVIDAAIEALGAAIHPIDDVRSTAAYRREAARRVVHRLLSEAVTP
jgi:CO/xanthine dehydrogenase FAD-binding subunit